MFYHLIYLPPKNFVRSRPKKASRHHLWPRKTHTTKRETGKRNERKGRWEKNKDSFPFFLWLRKLDLTDVVSVTQDNYRLSRRCISLMTPPKTTQKWKKKKGGPTTTTTVTILSQPLLRNGYTELTLNLRSKDTKIGIGKIFTYEHTSCRSIIHDAFGITNNVKT